MSLAVLIVDDDKAVQFYHRIMLSQSGLTDNPLEFNNGADVLRYLDEVFIPTNECLVLLDINMPKMTGWELLDRIGEKPYRKQVHVVMVTSSVNKADHEKAMSYDMVLELVEKPLSEEGCQLISTFAPIAPHITTLPPQQ